MCALAQNLWWSWDAETTSLFRELDPVLWRELDHNPVALLQQMPIDRLEERASQLALHSRINYAYRRMQEYLHSKKTWGARHAGVLWARPVAYFSAEFGLHESLPIYSGGLGILAGDHLKSASDLGIPLVGVGLYYDQGYFRQRLDRDGWQHEDYIDVDSRLLPMQPALNDGEPVMVSIETRTGTILARVWQLAVGRNTLLLLDSNVEGNRPEDRELTARLYGGDQRVRIRQELLLGIGGVRALDADGHHARRPASQRRPQRVRRARARAASHGGRRASTPGRRCAGCRRRSSSRRTRRCPPATIGSRRDLDRGAPGAAARRARTERRRADGARPRRSGQRRRRILHDGAGAQVVAARQRGVVACTAKCRAPCGRRSFRPARRAMPSACRSATSPTACTSTPGWRRRCVRSTTAISARTGRERAGDPGLWEGIDEVDDGELWETHQTLKVQLIDVARRRGRTGRRGTRRLRRSSSTRCGARSAWTR